MSRKPDDIAKSVEQATTPRGLPPLEAWHPELSGDMDLIITRDGQWLYQGAPIAREATVKLFATILRREDDGEYYLVTPVEKWRIKVEDTPLLAHSLVSSGGGEQQVLSVTTNVGEILEIGADHPLVVGSYPGTEEPRPIVQVRHGVEARLVTAAFYDLAERVEERDVQGEAQLGVLSHGKFWKIGQGG
ncbi:DUF1285 domain-containing protein [Marinobacter halophilus]|uniref:DUF1285 domain-containing protein n=1 Tax=Marinobacter halophilus TaxID=1323740 RepID=A0A2T1K844_9GAMM|nr:DUF1285 domain-containing protein [Marinobacter halophilus]PSF06334.1 DUF1285 domain-containing protein [Marinobacter halophilus]GGC71664.1 hypothetical protein GCM10011362_20240 [Marinobacter halophilus]